MTAHQGLYALIVDVLHDHGPTYGDEPQTERWQDCPRADAHKGTADRIIEVWSSIYMTRPLGRQPMIARDATLITSYLLDCGHTADVPGPAGATTGRAWCPDCGEGRRVYTYCLNCGDTFGQHSPDPDEHPCDLWSPSTLARP